MPQPMPCQPSYARYSTPFDPIKEEQTIFLFVIQSYACILHTAKQRRNKLSLQQQEKMEDTYQHV
jgi:hypothetical protein